jgi:hypothetical protein
VWTQEIEDGSVSDNCVAGARWEEVVVGGKHRRDKVEWRNWWGRGIVYFWLANGPLHGGQGPWKAQPGHYRLGESLSVEAIARLMVCLSKLRSWPTIEGLWSFLFVWAMWSTMHTTMASGRFSESANDMPDSFTDDFSSNYSVWSSLWSPIHGFVVCICWPNSRRRLDIVLHVEFWRLIGDVKFLWLSTIMDALWCRFEDGSELVLSSRFAFEDNKDVHMIYSSFNPLNNCKCLMMVEFLGVWNWLWLSFFRAKAGINWIFPLAKKTIEG